MSILVKGMTMPTCCKECAFVRTVGLDKWKCELSGCEFNSWDVGWEDGEENKYIRHSSCPLVEVPPHGRLIDADVLIEKYGEWYTEEGTEEGFIGTIKMLISMVPTVIEAEEGE